MCVCVCVCVKDSPGRTIQCTISRKGYIAPAVPLGGGGHPPTTQPLVPVPDNRMGEYPRHFYGAFTWNGPGPQNGPYKEQAPQW